MSSQFGAALRLFGFLTLLSGVAYPLGVTLVARLAFPRQAAGSLVERNGQIVGSVLIGQKFERPDHFWSRPSAIDFNPLPSGGSNSGPLNKDYRQKVETRWDAGARDEMLFASGSGLDPHIRPESAKRQIPRIVDSLGLTQDGREAGARRLAQLVDELTEGRQLSVFGDPRVNVLRLNLALDELRKEEKTLSP